MVSTEDVFSVLALFIMFRETVEASLVTAILLQLVVRLNRPDLKKWVWWGVCTGVSISILVGAGFIIAFYKFRTAIFVPESPSAETFAGIIAWIAAVIITILAFAMLRFLGWEAKWRRRLEAATAKALASEKEGATDEELALQAEEHEKERVAADRRDAWKVYVTISLVTLREGIEAVVFIAGVGNDKPSSIPLPAFIGIALGVTAGVFLYYSGKVVADLKWMFVGMTAFLLLMAAGQVVNGMHSLAEGNKLGGPKYEAVEEGATPTWYLKALWDTSICCGEDDTENKFFSLLHAIFGYQDKGNALGFILYFGYWAIISGVTYWKFRRGTLFDADYLHTKEQKAFMVEQELAAAAADGGGDGAGGKAGVIPLPDLKAVLAVTEKAGKEGVEMPDGKPPPGESASEGSSLTGKEGSGGAHGAGKV